MHICVTWNGTEFPNSIRSTYQTNNNKPPTKPEQNKAGKKKTKKNKTQTKTLQRMLKGKMLKTLQNQF